MLISSCHDLEWDTSFKKNIQKVVCKSKFGYFHGISNEKYIHVYFGTDDIQIPLEGPLLCTLAFSGTLLPFRAPLPLCLSLIHEPCPAVPSKLVGVSS